MVSKDELPYWKANTKPAGLCDGLDNRVAFLGIPVGTSYGIG
jgi:hypothetical protein